MQHLTTVRIVSFLTSVLLPALHIYVWHLSDGSVPHLMQEDSSLTRSDAYFLDLLKQADYVVTGSAVQRNFPKGLFKVRVVSWLHIDMSGDSHPSTCTWKVDVQYCSTS